MTECVRGERGKYWGRYWGTGYPVYDRVCGVREEDIGGTGYPV